MKSPAEKCPKCGCVQWNGPRYRKYFRPGDTHKTFVESLEFTCADCRYEMQVPCLDAKEAK